MSRRGRRVPGGAHEALGWLRRVLPPLAVAAWLPASPTSAQTIVGRIVDDARGSPVAGAIVRLLDRADAERAQAVADSAGRFTLTPPEDGEYVLEAVRLGYENARTPLLALHVGGTAPLELTMVPQPLGLPGLEVTVEARASELLDRIGTTPATLGNRWLSPAKVEAVAMKRDLGSIIEWNQVPGTFVIRDENTTVGEGASGDRMGLCVSMQRANTFGARRNCALVILNGSVVRGPQALMIDPESIEAMAVLVPREAATIYGTMGGGGAIVIWTRQGGR